MESTIYAGFEEYRVPNEAVKTAALKKGLVVLDANVLLNLYKMDESASRVWMTALQAVGSRLWIPHQAMAEFWRNRANAAAHPQTAYQTLNKIVSAKKSIEEEYAKWAFSRGNTEADAVALKEATASIELVINEVNDFIGKRTNRFSTDPAQDKLVQALDPLLKGKIGSEYDESKYKQLIEEGKKRFADKVPPGYLDDEKGTDKRYGDFLLWRQILEHFPNSQTKSSEAGPPPLVLVTADQKDDWWRKSETVAGEEPRRTARYELIIEARKVAGASLIMLSPTDFLKSAEKAFRIGLSQEIIDSTQAASAVNTPDNSGVIEEMLYLTLFGTRSAEGYEHESGITVVKGHTRATPTSTTPGHIINYRNSLLEQGVFKAVDDETWMLTEPHTFRSASTAAAVMLGRSANGLDEWKNADGSSINELRGLERTR